MNMSDEEFKKLYANLAPETQADLKRQLGITDPPVQPPAEWWQSGYSKPAPSTPQPGIPIVPQRIVPQRKIRPHQKHLWKWIIIGYGLIILSCVLPIILKIRP
jgi:hypothetical protein